MVLKLKGCQMFDRRDFVFASVATLSFPEIAAAKARAPTLLAHGGGEIPISLTKELRKLAKGRRLLIAPFAASNPASAAGMAKGFFRQSGFGKIDVLELSNANGAKAQIARADAVWFTGGIQSRQVQALKSIPGVHAALLTAFQSGTVMSGGSAGAAVLSKLMISGGSGGSVFTRTGLGFWPEVVLDQHVRQRGREYRLQKVISANRNLVGFGLDEGTWLTFANGKVKVRGSGEVHVVTWNGGQLVTTLLRRGQNYNMRHRG